MANKHLPWCLRSLISLLSTHKILSSLPPPFSSSKQQFMFSLNNTISGNTIFKNVCACLKSQVLFLEGVGGDECGQEHTENRKAVEAIGPISATHRLKPGRRSGVRFRVLRFLPFLSIRSSAVLQAASCHSVLCCSQDKNRCDTQ